jgi:hypothetical protein
LKKGVSMTIIYIISWSKTWLITELYQYNTVYFILYWLFVMFCVCNNYLYWNIHIQTHIKTLVIHSNRYYNSLTILLAGRIMKCFLWVYILLPKFTVLDLVNAHHQLYPYFHVDCPCAFSRSSKVFFFLK